jgi:NAD(P)-dependent dehydrogenase (short-subunit alcohol dehydrogenase family)
MSIIKRLLVVGVQSGGLGDAVLAKAREDEEVESVHSADLPGAQVDEALSYWHHELDIRSLTNARALLQELRPTHVCCTVGMNPYGMEDGTGLEWAHNFGHVMETNCIAVLNLAREWSVIMNDPHGGLAGIGGMHFCAVSSNSASVVRSGSAAYCASKAALSHGMMCLARDNAKQEIANALYVYEPGFLWGTPMSMNIVGSTDREREKDFHRIPSGFSIDPDDVAQMIINNFKLNWNCLNGSRIRVDGGDQ